MVWFFEIPALILLILIYLKIVVAFLTYFWNTLYYFILFDIGLQYHQLKSNLGPKQEFFLSLSNDIMLKYISFIFIFSYMKEKYKHHIIQKYKITTVKFYNDFYCFYHAIRMVVGNLKIQSSSFIKYLFKSWHSNSIFKNINNWMTQKIKSYNWIKLLISKLQAMLIKF